MLNQEQLLDYIRKAKSGDNLSKEILFNNNAPLLKSIIRRFKDKGVENVALKLANAEKLAKAKAERIEKLKMELAKLQAA